MHPMATCFYFILRVFASKFSEHLLTSQVSTNLLKSTSDSAPQRVIRKLWKETPWQSSGSDSASTAGSMSPILGYMPCSKPKKKQKKNPVRNTSGVYFWSCWASLVVQLVKNLPAMWETWVWSLGLEGSLEKGKATHSSILAWRIPWTV